MVKEFTGDWALILGGSSGLGLASAKKLAQHGMNICVIHRDRKSSVERIEKDFQEITAYGVELLSYNIDATRSDKRKEAIEKLAAQISGKGTIKCLVHSLSKGNLKAMVSDEAPVLQNDDFHLTIDAMAISLYDWTRTLFDAKLFSDNASIIAFTSEGNTKAWKHYAAVSAAKAALEAITRNIALEFAPYGIRANCIQAGVTDTPSLRMIPGNEQLRAFAVKRNPNKRLTVPEDVAGVVYLLCKEEAAWINGTVIPVDGGEHIS
ncbi:SDR family oxidoreductase [Flavobacteriaceae bacterium R38]|nr:SDR family oxidoreductase [Flavobacteriaceae bacterium R38]